MKRKFAASVTADGDWCVAQALEVDVAARARQNKKRLTTCVRLWSYTSRPPCRSLSLKSIR